MLVLVSGCSAPTEKLSFESMDSAYFGINMTRIHIVIPVTESTNAENVLENCPGPNCMVQVNSRKSIHNGLNETGEILVQDINMYHNERLILSAQSDRRLEVPKPIKKANSIGDLVAKNLSNQDLRSPKVVYKITEINNGYMRGLVSDLRPTGEVILNNIKVVSRYQLNPPGYESGEFVISYVPGHLVVTNDYER